MRNSVSALASANMAERQASSGFWALGICPDLLHDPRRQAYWRSIRLPAI